MLIQLDDIEIKLAIALYVNKAYNMDINVKDVRLNYDNMGEFISASIVREPKPTEEK